MTWGELETELERDERGLLERLLPKFIAHRLYGDRKERRERHKRQRRQTKSQLSKALNEIRPFRDRVQNELQSAKEHGTPLPENSFELRDELDEYLQRVNKLQGSLDEQYLRTSELEELRELASMFEQYREFIPIKRRFEWLIEPVELRLPELESVAEPYLEVEQYLTRHHRMAVDERLETVDSDLRQIKSEIPPNKLAEADRERVVAVEQRQQAIQGHFDGYNKQFVQQQLERCDELFSNVDAAGNDLNEAQRKAIVRNDTYNQIIAAAGTGKTLALIYRVAYLVNEQDVPPEEIAAITYTGQAAEEMETRLADQFGITDVEVSTIHALGFKIVQQASDDHRSVVQEEDIHNFIESLIREEIKHSNGAFQDHYLQFLAQYEESYASEADFESKTEYIAERAQEEYETLAGETVASRAEKVIADFLLMHGVPYQHEAIAEWADTAAEKDVYRPDFYLPNHDIYIEHWGINEAGEVAPWFSWSSEDYQQKMVWAREQFAESEQTLVETYDFEHQWSPLQLKAVLRHRLEQHDVTLERLRFSDLVDYVFEIHEDNAITELFTEFITSAKRFDITTDEIEARLDRRNPRQYHFGRCGEIVLRRYTEHREQNNLIDFPDMIHEAITAVEQNPEVIRNKYQHLLVDEFQDVAPSQVRLIQLLVGPDRARLFCVGDDWQSIYGFRGADPEYFTSMDEHFGPTTQTYLTDNYRCPPTILEAGNKLIANNPNQIEKTVTAVTDRDTTPELHTLSAAEDAEYRRYIGEYAVALVERLLEQGADPQDVMILCRYDDAVAYLDNVRENLEQQEIPYDSGNDHYRPPDQPHVYSDEFDPEAGVSVFSIHQSKGREANHVILLHAAEGELGFPSQERTNELLEPVQEISTDRRAEERRLFYVGITRASHELHIQTREGAVSPFVEEIKQHATSVRPLLSPGDIGDRTTLTAKVAQFFGNVNTLQWQAGYLYDGTQRVRFVSWASENPPELEGGTWYRLDGVEIDEFKNQSEIVIRGDTEVTELYREKPAE